MRSELVSLSAMTRTSFAVPPRPVLRGFVKGDEVAPAGAGVVVVVVVDGEGAFWPNGALRSSVGRDPGASVGAVVGGRGGGKGGPPRGARGSPLRWRAWE